MDTKKIVPTSNKRPPKAEIEQCKAIISRIDNYLPGTYAEEAQRILKVRGIIRSIKQIHDTRNGRNRHLPTALVLEKLAVVPKELNGLVFGLHETS